MNLDKLPHWLQPLVASLGGVGLFFVAFLDSSALSLPIINDLLVIHLSVRNPSLMPYYALMATLGSLAGCLLVYYLARKGGEVMFRKRAGGRAERIRGWIRRNAFLTVAIPSMLPPPMPFKLFVAAAGVFQVPLRTFVIALVAGRGLRYTTVGILAVRFGAEAGRYVLENKLQFSLIVGGLVILSYLLSRLVFRPLPPPPASP